uniref:Uncharacterized protein n=1 Tax=Cannabis sativa TaxID=3483 RepID=A0A803PVF6_CANSA
MAAANTFLLNWLSFDLPIHLVNALNEPAAMFQDNQVLVDRWCGEAHFLATKIWDSLCQPKQRSGLEFRKFEDINRALMAKLAWDIAGNVEKPWAMAFRAKFSSWESFWFVRPRASNFAIWKGILQARKIILEGACTIIANGRDVNIWW